MTETIQIAESPQPDPECAAIEAEAMLLYHPPKAEVRDYPLEWERQPETGKFFLGISTLVKETACDLALRVGTRTIEEDEPSVYAEVGNLVAEWHLKRITPHREIQLRLPIDDDFDLVGHPDGISLRPFGLVVHEAKHQDPDDESNPGGKIDLAQRQATCYLGMVDHMARAGVREFEPNRKFAAPESRGFRFDVPPAVWGIQVHFCPRTGPMAYTKASRVSAEMAEAALSLYTRKAKCVLVSVRAMWDGTPKDEALRLPGGALSHDFSVDGLQEFRVTPKAAAVGLENEDLLALVLHHANASRQEKRWGTIKDAAGARACALLEKTGQKSVEVDGEDGKVWAKPTAALASTGRSKYLRPNLRLSMEERELGPFLAAETAKRPIDHLLGDT